MTAKVTQPSWNRVNMTLVVNYHYCWGIQNLDCACLKVSNINGNFYISGNGVMKR